MQINGATTSIPIYNNVGKNNSTTPAAKPALDQAVIGFSGSSFSSLVSEANSQPDVRSEVVESYKSRIQSGAYPTQDTLSGLVDVIGGSIVKAAQAGA
jgi:anti-sigma28 factor (negative regulator of flagellin synthesis)